MGARADTEYNRVPMVMVQAMIDTWNTMRAKGRTERLLKLKDIIFCCKYYHELEQIEDDFMKMMKFQHLGSAFKGEVRRMAEEAPQTQQAAPGKGTFPQNQPSDNAVKHYRLGQAGTGPQWDKGGNAKQIKGGSKGSKGKGKGRKDTGSKGPYSDHRSQWRSSDWRSGSWSSNWNSWSSWG